MRMVLLRRVLAFLLLFSWPLAAAAHAILTAPPPRSQTDGITLGPCGGVAKGGPTPFKAGETITVSWNENVNHGGHYRVAFSPANDQGFESNVLADNIPSAGATGSTQVTLPSTPCANCTLQLVQVNTKPANYYSCADIALVLAKPDGGSDAGATPPPPPPPPPAGSDAGTVQPPQDPDGGAAGALRAGTENSTPAVTGGCGASTGASSGAAALVLAFALALALGRHARIPRRNPGRARRR